MQKRSVTLAVLLVAATLTSPASRAAETRPYHFQLEVLRVPAQAATNQSFVDRTTLQGLLDGHKIQEVDVISGDGAMGDELTMLAGHKIPLAFNDPRAGGYQVQYVDCGLKVRLKVAADDSGRLAVAISSEKVGLEEPGTTNLPYLQGVEAQTQFLMQPGQVVLFAHTRGELSRALKLAWPGVTFADSDSVVFALTVDTP